jgi:hypothetical protein
MNAKVIPLAGYGAVIKDTVRPYRLWDAYKNKFIPGYNYAHRDNAQIGALKLMHWTPPGATVEVIDVRIQKLVAAYTRKVSHENGRAVNSIYFYETKSATEEQDNAAHR